MNQTLAIDSVPERRNILLDLCGQDFETKCSSIEEELELRAQVVIREVALRTGDLPGLLCDLELLGIKPTGTGTGRIELRLIHEMAEARELAGKFCCNFGGPGHRDCDGCSLSVQQHLLQLFCLMPL